VDTRTGKLVRSVVTNAQPVAGKPAPQALDAAVRQIAAEQSLPPELLHSVIQVESNYNPGAVSPKGAQGLMQLIPETARRFGVSDSFDPVENIQGGAKYLKYLLDLYKGDYPRALAAYNAGEKAVAKYGGVPPYPETQNYVAQVKKRLDTSRDAKPPVQAKPEVKTVETASDEPRHILELVGADGAVRYVTR
jgi:soluble lytic murein transglycosylase-like protein